MSENSRAIKKYVFRNHTIEPMFPESEYSFSGYGDISEIPENCEEYIWFYQVPLKVSNELVAEEIRKYIDAIRFVINRIEGKTLLIISIECVYNLVYDRSLHVVKEAVNDYNQYCIKISKENANIKFIDFYEFIQMFKADDLIDWRYYFASQMYFSPKLVRPFTAWWKGIEDSLSLKRKKCLVLDLDNTLWGGVIGEDLVSGIELGEDYPGSAYVVFQKICKELSKNGIILAIASKNNESDVNEAFLKRKEMILSRNDFSSVKITWHNKADSITEIASDLNIGLDTIVFIDDSPSERELLKRTLPDVTVPEFPDAPYKLPSFGRELVRTYFSSYGITDEDREKTNQYKINSIRSQERDKFSDIDDYIRSLGIVLEIFEADEYSIKRISQMTQKTNQFNLTTKRYTEDQIREMVDNGSQIFCLSVSDKFGNDGITGLCIIEDNQIDTFLLSCRILGKGIEYEFLNQILIKMEMGGMRGLKASYIPTLKNKQVHDFYDKAGFKTVSEENGMKIYSIELNGFLNKNDKKYSVEWR